MQVFGFMFSLAPLLPDASELAGDNVPQPRSRYNPKCRSKSSRIEAQLLLVELARCRPEYYFELLRLLNQTLTPSPQHVSQLTSTLARFASFEELASRLAPPPPVAASPADSIALATAASAPSVVPAPTPVPAGVSPTAAATADVKQQQQTDTSEQPLSCSPLAVLPHDYECWPSDEQRMSTGFVGLRNLGATCYMNTSLQHLFTIPLARNAVLLQDPARLFLCFSKRQSIPKCFFIFTSSLLYSEYYNRQSYGTRTDQLFSSCKSSLLFLWYILFIFSFI